MSTRSFPVRCARPHRRSRRCTGRAAGAAAAPARRAPHVGHLEQGEHVVADRHQALEPAVHRRGRPGEHDRVADRGAGPRHRLEQVPGAGPAGGGEPGGDDRVRGGEHGQRAAADLAPGPRPDSPPAVSPTATMGGSGRHAHHRGDRRPDVVDAVLHGQQAHPGGVLPQRGGELIGVDGHGHQSTTRARMGRVSCSGDQTYDVVVLGAGSTGRTSPTSSSRAG